MTRYILSPEAQQDLNDIKAYLLDKTGVSVVRHVMGRIVAALGLLSRMPGAGHFRPDLTDEPVKF